MNTKIYKIKKMNMVKPIYGCIEKVEKEWVSVLFSDSQKSFTLAPLLSS